MRAFLLASLDASQEELYLNSDLYVNTVLATYEFTPNSLAYYQEYFGEAYQNHSLVVFDNKTPVLALYAFSKEDKFTHFNTPVSVHESAFASESGRQMAYKTLLIKLNELLRALGIRAISFHQNPFLLAEYSSKMENFDIAHELVIHLRIGEDEIKSKLRKSYKSLVNWGERNLEIEILSAENPDPDKFNGFKEFHIETAGKQTRSDESWELQFQSIKDDEAFAILANLHGRLVSASLILFGKETAYYGVGVYDRLLMSQNVAVGHYNILQAIFECKKRNLKSFNLGSILLSNTNEKEKSIFKFKAGFCNMIQPKVIYNAIIA